VANELDIGQSPRFPAQGGPGLLRLFTSWQGLLGDIAWRSVQATLA
jgi:hypothetical protein